MLYCRSRTHTGSAWITRSGRCQLERRITIQRSGGRRKNLADLGVRIIDYESGVTPPLRAATRRNIMGGLGLMMEQITKRNHDDLGADGWEISAHANSAPDHEPIQGRQYTDAEYEAPKQQPSEAHWDAELRARGIPDPAWDKQPAVYAGRASCAPGG